MRLLAIDPGDVESAALVFDGVRPEWWAKLPNAEILDVLAIRNSRAQHCDRLAIEMIASYGMPVGKTVFETCVWIGRFVQQWEVSTGRAREDVYRLDVKMHLCGSARARDSNVRQALIDRYGPSKEQAIGRKASPGPLYGLSGDGWAALGVAVTATERGASQELPCVAQ